MNKKNFGILLCIFIPILLAVIYKSSYATMKGNNNKEGKSMLELIMSLEEGAMKRWQTGDVGGWSEISAPEVTYIDPDLSKPIDGLKEYKAYLKQFEGEINYQHSEFINPKVAVHDRMVVLTYNYKDSQQNEDGSKINQTHWNTTEVYAMINSEWKIIHTHWSFVKHHLPVNNPEVPIPIEISPRKWKGAAGEIMNLEKGAMERWRKGDPWGFIEISAPDVTYFDTGTPKRLDGLKALKAEYKKRVGKIHYDVMEFIAPKIQIHGDSAVLSYRFFSTVLNPDGSIKSRTPWNCTEVYFKSDGKWKIIHTHWSYIKGRMI